MGNKTAHEEKKSSEKNLGANLLLIKSKKVENTVDDLLVNKLFFLIQGNIRGT